MAERRPNFVVFMPDQLRAESLGCYGHPVVRTPTFDRLAAEGTRFEQCHTPSPLCTPARCAMLTGWPPWVAGHRSLHHLLQPHEPSVFKTLRRAGYEVVCCGKNDVFTPGHAEQAVDRYFPTQGTYHGDLLPPGDPRRMTFLAGAFCADAADTSDMRSVRRGIDFISGRSPDDPPFVLFLALSSPHPPYGSPEPWHSLYDEADLPPLRPPLQEPAPCFHRLVRQARGLNELEPAVFQLVQRRYLGMVSYVDWMLGQLLEALDASAVAPFTHLLATSDHGDFAGDYGMVEKWHNCLTDVMTRVPMIVRGPGVAPGERRSDPCSLADFTPTVLALAGVAAEHAHPSRDLFAPRDERIAPDEAVLSDGGFPTDQPHCFEGYYDFQRQAFADPHHLYRPQADLHQQQPTSVCRSLSIRTWAHRLVYRQADTNELYDLKSDPLETVNRIDDAAYQRVRHQLEYRLFRQVALSSDATPMTPDARDWP